MLSPYKLNSIVLITISISPLKLAAQKMVMYWEYKVKLFGPEIAFRPGGKIFLSDLNDDDLATLDAKGLFWLPNDEAGRGVMFSRRQLWTFRHFSNLVGSLISGHVEHFVKLMTSSRKLQTRLAWYLVHVALEDVSVQKNGIVCIMYNAGSYSISENFDRKGLNMLLQVARRALPFRVVGVHHCYTSKIYNIILPFVLSCLGREIRSRHRLHFDSNTMLANILKYGLSADSLPVIMGGKLELDPAAWKEERRRKEQGFVH